MASEEPVKEPDAPANELGDERGEVTGQVEAQTEDQPVAASPQDDDDFGDFEEFSDPVPPAEPAVSAPVAPPPAPTFHVLGEDLGTAATRAWTEAFGAQASDATDSSGSAGRPVTSLAQAHSFSARPCPLPAHSCCLSAPQLTKHSRVFALQATTVPLPVADLAAVLAQAQKHTAQTHPADSMLTYAGLPLDIVTAPGPAQAPLVFHPPLK